MPMPSSRSPGPSIHLFLQGCGLQAGPRASVCVNVHARTPHASEFRPSSPAHAFTLRHGHGQHPSCRTSHPSPQQQFLSGEKGVRSRKLHDWIDRWPSPLTMMAGHGCCPLAGTYSGRPLPVATCARVPGRPRPGLHAAAAWPMGRSRNTLYTVHHGEGALRATGSPPERHVSPAPQREPSDTAHGFAAPTCQTDQTKTTAHILRQQSAHSYSGERKSNTGHGFGPYATINVYVTINASTILFYISK